MALEEDRHQLDVKDIERSLADKTTQASPRSVSGAAATSTSSSGLRHDMPTEPLGAVQLGTLYAQWFASGGTQGKKPTDDQLLKAYDILRQGAGVESGPRVQLGPGPGRRSSSTTSG